ncbi:MAG: lytic murein transglycosylase B [Vicinamibacteria bacterium]
MSARRVWELSHGRNVARWYRCAAALIAFSLLAPSGTDAGSVSRVSNREVQLFIESMAEKHGFDAVSLEGLFNQARFEPRVLDTMTKSAGRKTWDDYRVLFVNGDHIQRGVRFWDENADALAKARESYGVPEELITAIIGIETHYGKNTGRFRVLDALTTLAFQYPPRAETFLAELEQYLLLTREEQISPLEARGSYAGAMGIAQFMPGSYRYFAVDFDGDGRRDLFDNIADAIGSVANYLSRHGWRAGERTVVRARVAGEHYLPYANSGLELNHLVAQWKWLGVTPTEDVLGNEAAMLFSLTRPAGPEYWLGLNNFYVITRYNRSSYYAMAVHELGREIRSLREQEQSAPAP